MLLKNKWKTFLHNLLILALSRISRTNHKMRHLILKHACGRKIIKKLKSALNENITYLDNKKGNSLFNDLLLTSMQLTVHILFRCKY